MPYRMIRGSQHTRIPRRLERVGADVRVCPAEPAVVAETRALRRVEQTRFTRVRLLDRGEDGGRDGGHLCCIFPAPTSQQPGICVQSRQSINEPAGIAGGLVDGDERLLHGLDALVVLERRERREVLCDEVPRTDWAYHL